MEYFGDIVYVNGEYVSPSAIPKFGSLNIYEVIRIIDGKILFWEEHFERLLSSLKSFNCLNLVTKDALKSVIQKLVLVNNMANINVRINIYLDDNVNVVIGFIPSIYPSSDMYVKGVKTLLYKAQRINPAIKVVHPNLHADILRLKEQNKVYEVLLVDQNNCVTEGSRSNLFFIKGNCVYTAPSKEVLIGITRTKVVLVCKELGIPVVEEPILVERLSAFDACFISGTSPKVLPLCAIDFNVYQTDNRILQIIMNEYNNMINSVLY